MTVPAEMMKKGCMVLTFADFAVSTDCAKPEEIPPIKITKSKIGMLNTLFDTLRDFHLRYSLFNRFPQ